MNQDQWERLKTATWFREEQDKVTVHVEQLRATLESCRRGHSVAQGCNYAVGGSCTCGALQANARIDAVLKEPG